jgi:hypothetical protein
MLSLGVEFNVKKIYKKYCTIQKLSVPLQPFFEELCIKSFFLL